MRYRNLKTRVDNAVRLAEVLQVLARHGFADLLRRLRLYEGLPAKVLRRLRIIEDPTGLPETLGARLRAALTELGPTFVKFGQVMSTRPDVLGDELCAELRQLQDRVAEQPFPEFRSILEEDLGGPLGKWFAEFDETPVASASLSQVYRARTRTGRDVAVKIQRPGVRRVIESDLNLLFAMAEWITEHVEDYEWMQPVGMVEEFRRSIRRELDFTIEAGVIRRFRQNYAGASAVFVPRVEQELSGPRVLTMDWIDGVRVDALEEYAARNCDPTAVAAAGCETLCQQVFEHHLFHADPHPGNIYVTRDNQIAFLDYGMVGRLEKDDVDAMADLLRAVFEEDAARCVKASLRFTVDPEVGDPVALEHEVGEYIAFEAQAILGKAEVGRALRRVTEIMRRHKLQLAPRFSLLLKAMATIESTARVLDASFDFATVIRPYVERIIAQRFAPQHFAREAQHSLVELAAVARELPLEIQQVVHAARRGKLRVHLDHERLDFVAHVTDRASNRIAFSVIAGALIIGSSMLLATDAGAKTLGFAGFTIAGALGVALLISIIRSKNY